MKSLQPAGMTGSINIGDDDSLTDDFSVSEDSKTENLLFVGCSPLREPGSEKMPLTVCEASLQSRSKRRDSWRKGEVLWQSIT